MKRIFAFMSALILCTPAWSDTSDVIDASKDASKLSGILPCVLAGFEEDGSRFAEWYSGDCLAWAHDTNATKAECKPQVAALDGVYKKYKGKLIIINKYIIDPLMLPEPDNGKIYRCVSTECKNDEYEPKNGWCQKKKTNQPSTTATTADGANGNQPNNQTPGASETTLAETDNNNSQEFSFEEFDVQLDRYFTTKYSDVWKDESGNFNTARLTSDSIAGVVLGTTGGIITSQVIKKNQLKRGFQDLKCVIGGQDVAAYGDEFSVGLK